MPTPHDIAVVKESCERQVNENRARGVNFVRMTPLERAAFEEGRLSVLKWLCPDEEQPQ